MNDPQAKPARLSALTAILLSSIVVGGCQPSHSARPLALPVPTTLFTQDYFQGSVLSGSVGGPISVPLSTQIELALAVHSRADEQRDQPTTRPTTSQPTSASSPATDPTSNPATAPATDTQLAREDANITRLMTAINPLSVHVTFVALENVPATSFTPVGSRAVFFSSTAGGNAVLPAAELTRGAVIADLKDPADLPALLRAGNAGRITPMKSMVGSLVPGVTAEFSALDPTLIHDIVTGTDTRRCVMVVASRSPQGLPQVALVLTDLVNRPEGHLSLITEKALFNLPADDTTSTALIVPFQFDHAASKCVAVLIGIGPATAGDAAATTQCFSQLAQSGSSTQPAISTGQASASATVRAAVQSLAPVNGRRSALTFLADQTGASLCEDVAMEGDDATLAALVQNIQANVAANPGEQTDPSVGWLLDQTTLQLLAKLSADAANGTKVGPELLAILTAHTGEVGRHPSSLDELLKGVASRQDLDNRLLAENTIFLEDSSPASRVRAYDWLNARHLAPAGYDPLGDSKARRDALEKASAAP